ncbi:hypothetical protein BT63DRAFT_133811 [Microthyrium microscopicum]|uniref:CBM1 domain-containing protein n=1 Tax=Microthyrium microscopicum TaxID=703497 RepID=A0A6A6UP72_9PEZI|nr:hypothetical protein BT63DRAFT_133811 [Microthyrium microscopicum]
MHPHQLLLVLASVASTASIPASTEDSSNLQPTISKRDPQRFGLAGPAAMIGGLVNGAVLGSVANGIVHGVTDSLRGHSGPQAPKEQQQQQQQQQRQQPQAPAPSRSGERPPLATWGATLTWGAGFPPQQGNKQPPKPANQQQQQQGGNRPVNSAPANNPNSPRYAQCAGNRWDGACMGGNVCVGDPRSRGMTQDAICVPPRVACGGRSNQLCSGGEFFWTGWLSGHRRGMNANELLGRESLDVREYVFERFVLTGGRKARVRRYNFLGGGHATPECRRDGKLIEHLSILQETSITRQTLSLAAQFA